MPEHKLIQLDKKTVERLFAESSHQADVVIGLYRMVYPDPDVWDKISHMTGFPKVNEHTTEELFRMFIDFDRKHHPNVVNGGAWLSHGFSSSGDHLADWQVEPCEYELKSEV